MYKGLVWWEGEWQREGGKGLLLATKYFARQPGLQSQYCQDWLEGANIDFHLHTLEIVKHTVSSHFPLAFPCYSDSLNCKLKLF